MLSFHNHNLAFENKGVIFSIGKQEYTWDSAVFSHGHKLNTIIIYNYIYITK